MCLCLFLSESTLKARRCLSWNKSPVPENEEHLIGWLYQFNHDDTPPSGYWSYFAFADRNPLSWLFGRICRRFQAQTCWYQHVLTLILVEIVLPIRLGSSMQWILLIVGLITVSFDLIIGYEPGEWGFGQLLPAFMLFLPLFSLFERYASEFL